VAGKCTGTRRSTQFGIGMNLLESKVQRLSHMSRPSMLPLLFHSSAGEPLPMLHCCLLNASEQPQLACFRMKRACREQDSHQFPAVRLQLRPGTRPSVGALGHIRAMSRNVRLFVSKALHSKLSFGMPFMAFPRYGHNTYAYWG
jgi:hypothetical protein